MLCSRRARKEFVQCYLSDIFKPDLRMWTAARAGGFMRAPDTGVMLPNLRSADLVFLTCSDFWSLPLHIQSCSESRVRLPVAPAGNSEADGYLPADSSWKCLVVEISSAHISRASAPYSYSTILPHDLASFMLSPLYERRSGNHSRPWCF